MHRARTSATADPPRQRRTDGGSSHGFDANHRFRDLGEWPEVSDVERQHGCIPLRRRVDDRRVDHVSGTGSCTELAGPACPHLVESDHVATTQKP